MMVIVLLIVLVVSLVMIPVSIHYRQTPKGRAVVAERRAASKTRAAKQARYCTKHQIAKPIPGGPEHLVWVYGPHRTTGNQCDGPEHRRAALGGWW
jgi:hypothetical protein